MNCLCRSASDETVHPLLMQYAAGTLPVEQVEIVLAAIRACDECRRKLEAVVVDDDLMQSLRVPESDLLHVDDAECNSAIDSVRRMVDEILNPDSDITKRSDETALQYDSRTPDYDVKAIGQYKIREVLGKGGMGTVFKGIHPQLEKVVAIKLLKADLSKDYNAVARFQREMKAVGRLDHPNIVRATDAGEADGHMFLVMEYVDGVDLRSVVDMGGPLTVPDACEIVRQSAVGLYHAHEHGLVHRDIKPNNIRLSRQGYAKILDLGLARATWDEGAGGEGQLTQTSQICGTYDYMPPEQWESTHQVDHRGDIYSLGCTFYFLLTGHAPFDHPKYQGNYLSKMRAHLIEPAPPIGDSRHDVPAEVVAILDKMLAKDPNDRFASAAEIVYAIEPFCREHRLLNLVGGSASGPGSGPVTQPLSHPSAVLSPPRPSSGSVDRPSTAAPSTTSGVGSTSTILAPASIGMRMGMLAFGLVGAIGIGVLISQLLNRPSPESSSNPVREQPVQTASAVSGANDEINSDTTTKPDGQQTAASGEKTAENKFGDRNEVPPKMEVAVDSGNPPTPMPKIKPLVVEVPSATIQEGQRYSATMRVENGDAINGKFRFALAADAPGGAFVNPQTGKFSWTPEEKHGPGEYVLAVQLLSQDDTVDDAAVTWQVKVQEVNESPVLEPPKNYAIDEMKSIEFVAQANDADEPANSLTFELAGDVPQGATIDPNNGRFEWAPSESQGPGEYTISVRVSDDGKPSRVDFKKFNVVVNEVNQAPVFEPLADERADDEGNILLGPGETLAIRVQAKDADVPPQQLNYKLDKGAPEGMQLNAETGELSWTVADDDVGKQFSFDVVAVETEGTERLTGRQSVSLLVDRYQRNALGIRLAQVPAGVFLMGNTSGDVNLPGLDDLIPGGQPVDGATEVPTPNLNPNLNPKLPGKPPMYPADERPVRTIRITHDFQMSAHEVTQEQYAAVMGENPSYYSAGGDGADLVAELPADRLPVESVTWDDAVEFCRRLSELPQEKAAGRVYRLPTEAEWEYACRAGKKGTDYSVGAAISSKEANFNGTAAMAGAEPGPFLNRTATVGSYAPNEWGLFDMHGNVAEWCLDWYAAEAYKEIVHENPQGPQLATSSADKKLDSRVIRGGSWYDRGFECRSARRYKQKPFEKTRMLGFRIVCETAGDEADPTEAAATEIPQQ